jgi:hypothetical protein
MGIWSDETTTDYKLKLQSDGLHFYADRRVPQRYSCDYSVVPLPPETIHAYLDKFPAILIQKIREKF